MERHSTWIFLGVSVAFFLFITGLTGYRIDATRRANAAAARGVAQMLAARATALAEQAAPATGDPFATPLFKGGMREVFASQQRLLLLTVRSDAAGILWLMTRNRAWLVEPREISPSWRGLPVYEASRGYESLVTLPMDGDAVVLDSLFVVFGKEDLFPILRDDLYLFLAFLLACGIFILLATGLAEEHAPQPAPVPPVQPPPRPVPGRSPAAPFVAPRPAVAPAPVPPVSPGPAASTPAAGVVRSLTSPTTGLVWAEHLGPRLSAEIERAASMDQDLAFARVLLDSPAGTRIDERTAREAARLLREAFPIADLLFESGPGAFSVVVPDADLDLVVRRLEGLRAKLGEAGLSASVGASARGARLIEENTLLVEAEIAADKAHREGGNRVIGFRADPAKFRAALSGF